MHMTEKPDRSCDVQNDIYRVALALDSLIVNGVQLGVIGASLDGFIESQGEKLLKDVDALQDDLPHAAAGEQQEASATLDKMRAGCAELIDLLTRLKSFRSFSLTGLLAAVSQVSRYREEAIRLIGILENCFHTSRPFYANRSKEAAAAVDGFLADLPRIFEAEWSTARSKASAHST